jgi:hypothetical protein
MAEIKQKVSHRNFHFKSTDKRYLWQLVTAPAQKKPAAAGNTAEVLEATVAGRSGGVLTWCDQAERLIAPGACVSAACRH